MSTPALNVPFGSPGKPEVTVCIATSLFVHCTVVPTDTFNGEGKNSKPSIVIASAAVELPAATVGEIASVGAIVLVGKTTVAVDAAVFVAAGTVALAATVFVAKTVFVAATVLVGTAATVGATELIGATVAGMVAMVGALVVGETAAGVLHPEIKIAHMIPRIKLRHRVATCFILICNVRGGVSLSEYASLTCVHSVIGFTTAFSFLRSVCLAINRVSSYNRCPTSGISRWTGGLRIDFFNRYIGFRFALILHLAAQFIARLCGRVAKFV